jgi:translation initiation factor IF-2
MRVKKIGRFHVLTDTVLQSRYSHLDLARQAIAGGADTIQFRHKAGSTRQLIEAASEVRALCRRAGVCFIVNDRLDVAMASDAVIVGFSVGVDPKAQHLAEQEGVEIRRYNVIYEAIDDLKKAMEGLLAPKMVKKLIGKAEVRKVFEVSRVGQIAGTYVLSGHEVRSAEIKVVRGKETVFTGRLASLKRYKDDVREVKQGLECGIAIEGFDGLQEGDLLEFYEQEAVRETIQVV